MYAVRFHGRWGQGAKTASRIFGTTDIDLALQPAASERGISRETGHL